MTRDSPPEGGSQQQMAAGEGNMAMRKIINGLFIYFI
jgi:hypothetical protein